MSLFQDAPTSVCCVHLAVLGTVGCGLASSAHEWLLQRLAAVIAQLAIADALGRCVLRPWHLLPLLTLVKRQALWANGFADAGEPREDVVRIGSRSGPRRHRPKISFPFFSEFALPLPVRPVPHVLDTGFFVFPAK